MNDGEWSRPVALTVAAAFFIEQVDGTILATATPAVARDLGVAPADVGLAMTAYLAAVAAFIPVSGWLADRFGRRRVFLAAIAGFVGASVLCGLSTSLGMLVGARIIQGVAGAMMVPVGRLVVLGNAAKSDLIRAVAYLTWPALAAPVIAPFIGGVLTQYAGWPWIFFVNVPLGAVLWLVAWRVVPNHDRAGPREIDGATLALVMAGIVAVVIGLEQVTRPGRWPLALAELTLAAVLLVIAVRRALRHPTLVLDLRAFGTATFRTAHAAGAGYRIAVASVPFLIPLLLQDGFGRSPVEAGLLLMWVFIGNLGIKVIATPLLRGAGFTAVIVAATVGLAATLLACAFLTPVTPVAVTAGVLLASGAFRSIGFSAYNTMQFADIAPAEMNGANTLASTIVQLANGLAIALSALVVRAVDLTRGPAGALGYRVALAGMGVLALLSLIGVLRLPRGAADHLRGPRNLQRVD